MGASVISGVLVVAAWLLLASGAVADRDYDQALARWESQEPAVYSFEYVYCSGMCLYCPVPGHGPRRRGRRGGHSRCGLRPVCGRARAHH
ncbi:hypothetical protein [Nocardioides sp.]|uniref:hypothetical protein n=1 Tax=Nocardioides sp. TaxID=35761 RepID=UPI002B7116DF|nr:hypothetical protein [Nocardioides sp.]HXH79368.1 hypothetical protein [Nocardioides sp.]